MTLASAILDLEANELGETLRALTFPGEGYGCYSTFAVRRPALKWARPRRRRFWEALDHCDPEYLDECADLGEGYSLKLDGLTVHVCWYWEGDGILAFDARVGSRRRVVVNYDCKKDYGWEDEEVGR